jgi:hypothetical protein
MKQLKEILSHKINDKEANITKLKSIINTIIEYFDFYVSKYQDQSFYNKSEMFYEILGREIDLNNYILEREIIVAALLIY